MKLNTFIIKKIGFCYIANTISDTTTDNERNIKWTWKLEHEMAVKMFPQRRFWWGFFCFKYYIPISLILMQNLVVSQNVRLIYVFYWPKLESSNITFKMAGDKGEIHTWIWIFSSWMSIFDLRFPPWRSSPETENERIRIMKYYVENDRGKEEIHTRKTTLSLVLLWNIVNAILFFK